METPCVLVSSKQTHEMRKLLENLQLNDETRRLKHIKPEGKVAIPISDEYTPEQIQKMLTEKIRTLSSSIDFDIRKMVLQLAKKLCIKSPETKVKQSVKTLLEKKGYKMTEDLMREVPSHWEMHGDLALVSSTAFTSQLWHTLGTELWQEVAGSLACSRLARKGVVSQDGFRTPQVTLLLGDTGWVEQVDNGIRYTYDITKCMFSSGNITEKLRVARLDCTDEVVVDLYAGIGYFTLPYLVYTGVKHLHACEWNLDAVEALYRNLDLNNVQDRCTIHAGDNRQTCPRGIADRVNLGLIPSSRPGWEPACAALRPATGGTLHIHYNVNKKPVIGNQPSSEPTEAFRQEAKACNHHRNCVNSDVDSFVENNDARVLSSVASQTDTRVESNKVLSANEIQLHLEPSCSQPVDNYNTNDLTEFNDDDHGCSFNDRCEDNQINGSCLDKSVSDNSINHRDRNIIKKQLMCEDETDVRQLSRACSKWLRWSQGVAMEIKAILEGIHGNTWTTHILHIEHVKSYAPYVDHLVLDLQCKPIKALN